MRGVNKIVKSIEFPQPKANKHVPPLISSFEISSQRRDTNDISRVLLEELGVSSQQFKILFGKLPQGVVLYKMIYDEEGKPIDFIPLESNKGYENIQRLRGEQIGKRATQFNPKIKDYTVDWTMIYGRIAATGMPEQCEIYCEPANKWYE